jgi:outer membrane lipoprotein SlyB
MRHASRFISVVSSVLVVAGLTACAASAPMNSQGPVSSYPAPYPAASYPAQAPQGNYVEYGRVSNVEVLRTQEQGKGSGLGAVIGGVAGAVVGHQIGGGSGRDAATVVGAVGGAVAGNAVEKNRNTNVRETYRVSIQLDNGVARAYDVPSYGELRIGDRVKIENGQLFRIM